MAERSPSYQRNVLRSLLLLSLVLPTLPGCSAHAQHAEETARQRIRLKAYGLFSYVEPDFGDSSERNFGGTIGGTIDGLRLLPHTELGLDVRYAYSHGTISDQIFYAGGPRVSVNVGRFTPYVDFLFGHGKGVFNEAADPNYTSDVTGALTYGGGLDYQLNRTWGLRADVQRERWRISMNQPYFYPAAASIGVTYQFRFRSRTGPNL